MVATDRLIADESIAPIVDDPIADEPARRTGTSGPPPAGGGWRACRALAGAGLSFLGAVAFAPAFGGTAGAALADPRYVGLTGGAVAVVAGVCLPLAMGSRTAPVNRMAAALAALAGYVLLAVAPGWAVADGPKRLLTSALPLEAGGPELATVVIVVGLAALGAIEPALRRGAAALPLAAPVAAIALGSIVSAGGGAPAGWLAPAFAAGAAIVLVLARYAPEPGQTAVRPDSDGNAAGPARRTQRSRWTRPAAGAALVGALLAGVAAAGWYGSASLLSTEHRDAPADVRNLVPQQVRPREGASPLVLYPALRRGESRLSLTVHAAQPPRLLRYVSLDDFDGEHWTTAARYRRTGGRLPAEKPEPVRPRVTIRTERVDITKPGPLGWLVSSGRPVELSVGGMGVNEDTGDVVLPADRRIPAEYTVRSALPAYDAAALASATAPTSAPAPAAGSLVLPEKLTSLATRIVGNETGYTALRRLTDYFRSPGPPDSANGSGAPRPDFRVDLTRSAPGGHGLFQIDRLLDTGDGTAEQYASALAVLARSLGYETRVVMGFRPRPSGPETYTVTEKDVHAWVEVRFAGLGWVPFDPTPSASTTDANRPAPPPAKSPLGRAGQDDQSAQAPNQANQAGGRARKAAGAGRGRRPIGYAGLALAAAGGLLVLYAGVVPLARSQRRRRRRRQGGPDRRTVAAWRDTVEALVAARVGVVPADTSGEVVAAARRRFGERVGVPVRRLAFLHDEAAFAPGRVAPPTADTAWRHADRARREIRALLPPRRRLRAALSARALRTRLPSPRLRPRRLASLRLPSLRLPSSRLPSPRLPARRLPPTRRDAGR